MIRKFGVGDGRVLGTPVTEEDPQGISTTAANRTAEETWTDQDAAELAQENRES